MPSGSSRRGHRGKRARPFVVPIAALRKQVGASREEHRHGLIGGLAALGVAVPDDAEVGLDLVLSSYPGGLMAVGTVTAPWSGECRRCGGTVSGTVMAAVRERFAPSGGSGEDEDAYPLSGDELDLEPLARDAVMLDLPLAPLCSDDCRGLCPRCGVNWNVSECDCPPELDPRWSALDTLRDVGRGPQDGGLT